jgi:hypothetical protein
MAQFVTHIQPTLVEASHHHLPHHHKDSHIKDHHLFHVKEPHPHHHEINVNHHKDHHKESHHKETHHKESHHAREFPVLPHPHMEQSSHNGHEAHDADYKTKRDSGQYMDSHGVSHTFQLRFVDSQGIHRDCHGHGINREVEKERHQKQRDHHEDKSPYKSVEEGAKPVPPQFIDLHGPSDNKNVSLSMSCRVELKQKESKVGKAIKENTRSGNGFGKVS